MGELLDFILNNEESFKSNARLASLYSDFRHQRETNRAGFDANVDSWRNALEHAARAGKLSPSSGGDGGKSGAAGSGDGVGGLLSVRVGDDLFRELETRGLGRPVGLGVALAEMVRRHDWTPTSKHILRLSDVNGSSKGWIEASLAVMAWASRQLGITGPAELVSGDFVMEKNVEAAGHAFLRRLKSDPPLSYPDRIHSLSTFTTTFCNILTPTSKSAAQEDPTSQLPSLTQSDIQILLHHLTTTHKLLSYSPLTQTIAIRPSVTDLDLTNPKTTTPAPPVTTTDTSVATLKTLDADLTAQIATLERRVADLSARARVLASSTSTASTSSAASKASALAAIRSRRAAEKALETRYRTHAQVTDSLAAITDAADRVALVTALQGGAEVLRNLNAEVGGVEGAERVAARFREEMDVAEEVGEVIHAGVGAGEGIDEEEVEGELEGLEREAEEGMRREREKVEEGRRREVERLEEERAREVERRLAELGRAEGEMTGMEPEKEKEKQEGAEAMVVDGGSGHIEQQSEIEIANEVPAYKQQQQQQEEEDVAVLESMDQLGRMSLDEVPAPPPPPPPPSQHDQQEPHHQQQQQAQPPSLPPNEAEEPNEKQGQERQPVLAS